jgi:hypothetical protein
MCLMPEVTSSVPVLTVSFLPQFEFCNISPLLRCITSASKACKPRLRKAHTCTHDEDLSPSIIAAMASTKHHSRPRLFRLQLDQLVVALRNADEAKAEATALRSEKLSSRGGEKAAEELAKLDATNTLYHDRLVLPTFLGKLIQSPGHQTEDRITDFVRRVGKAVQVSADYATAVGKGKRTKDRETGRLKFSHRQLATAYEASLIASTSLAHLCSHKARSQVSLTTSTPVSMGVTEVPTSCIRICRT